MVGFRGLFNLFLPQFFEMRCADWKWICIYLAIRIYGLLFEDVYKSIKKKEIAEGQLFSECLFDILNFQKKQRKIWQISALETKMWSNQLYYNTNYMGYLMLKDTIGCLYFMIWPLFRSTGRNLSDFLLVFWKI